MITSSGFRYIYTVSDLFCFLTSEPLFLEMLTVISGTLLIVIFVAESVKFKG